MGQAAEPGHGEWIARMRERARLDARELLPRPPFRVLGLAGPELRPVALAEAGQVDGGWVTITLAYGDWADPAGPFVAVTSAAVRPDAAGLGAGAELLGVIDEERNRLADHAGVDEPEPPEPPVYGQEELLADGTRIRALVCRHGPVWAARLQTGEVAVTVVGRSVRPGSVRLGPVADLEPYLRGRNEMLGQLAEHYRRRPRPALEPAAGVAAYRALAEAALRSHERDRVALRAGRVPRYRAGEGAAMSALWQRAVREQERISGAGARQADEIVTRVVNHLTHLQEQAPWFTAEPRLREAAIDETLRNAVLGEDVPSRAAQQAWARYWEHHMSLLGLEPGAALRSELAAGGPLTSGWLQAWSAWAGR
jgi:hypothetical protein